MDSPTPHNQSLTPEWDTILQALTASRRRAVLVALDDAEEGLSISDLATTVLTEESGSPTDAEVDRVAAALHHTHIPKLTAAGLVTEAAADRVALTEDARTHPVAIPLARWSHEPDTIPNSFADAARSD